MDQSELSRTNQTAWNSDSYAAWVNLYGTPAEVANTLRGNPTYKVRRLIDHLPAIENLKIANPLGSHGRMATALALLGANVTVFDISESNAKYRLELSEAAGVVVDYVVGEFQIMAYYFVATTYANDQPPTGVRNHECWRSSSSDSRKLPSNTKTSAPPEASMSTIAPGSHCSKRTFSSLS